MHKRIRFSNKGKVKWVSCNLLQTSVYIASWFLQTSPSEDTVESQQILQWLHPVRLLNGLNGECGQKAFLLQLWGTHSWTWPSWLMIAEEHKANSSGTGNVYKPWNPGSNHQQRGSTQTWFISFRPNLFEFYLFHRGYFGFVLTHCWKWTGINWKNAMLQILWI